MPIVNLTADTFAGTVSAPGMVLVDFWAAWCGPCRAFAPVFERASAEHPDAVFAKVDTEAEQRLAGSLGITSIPTLMIFRDGVLLYAEPGALPAPALGDLIGQAKALDMEAVLRQVREREANALPEEVEVDTALELLDEGAVLVDVREVDEWRAGHAPHASHIPLGRLTAEAAKLDKDVPVVVMCASGSRSRSGAAQLRSLGYRATSLGGGIAAWRAAGAALA